MGNCPRCGLFSGCDAIYGQMDSCCGTPDPAEHIRTVLLQPDATVEIQVEDEIQEGFVRGLVQHKKDRLARMLPRNTPPDPLALEASVVTALSWLDPSASPSLVTHSGVTSWKSRCSTAENV